jgi:hypothetical protein
VFGTYFSGYCFYFGFGVYYFAFVRADFINNTLLLLLLLLTCDLLFGLNNNFGGFFGVFLFGSTLPIERLLLSFFSLLDFLSAFLLSGLLPFLGSIDL